jgi:hypothetical protein
MTAYFHPHILAIFPNRLSNRPASRTEKNNIQEYVLPTFSSSTVSSLKEESSAGSRHSFSMHDKEM